MPNPNHKQENPLLDLDRNLKIAYVTGQNTIGRTMTRWGFLPSKNAALNYGSLFGNPYDPAQRIRPGDPAQQLRILTSKIGQIERITNTYGKPRVKLAD